MRDSDDKPMGKAVQLDKGWIDVAKNKPMGRLGSVPVVFDDARLRFVETGG
ncbi:MAG: hypothetical protein LC798_20755 [Chloroflexi bacterium]|nr:hypothetical protein [Chloroflexota bacterium]